jgi:hypothetical protein
MEEKRERKQGKKTKEKKERNSVVDDSAAAAAAAAAACVSVHVCRLWLASLLADWLAGWLDAGWMLAAVAAVEDCGCLSTFVT